MSNERIQIVDDEHDFVRFLSKCLQRMDYLVTDVATTGESAIAAARRSKPDLVLMDISLPGGMDGIEAATRIRRQLGIPVVYLTGSDDENTVQRAKMSEPLGYLLKPFKPRELKTTIDTALYTFRANRERTVESDRLAGELNRSLFGEMIESLPHLFWSCRPDGTCDYLSRQWTQYTGIPTVAPLESGWLSVLHADDREATEAAWREALRCGRDFAAECRIRGVGGSPRWFRMRAISVRDSEGKVLKWFGSGTDIDDEKRELQALVGSRRALESVLSNVPQRIFWKDQELRFVGCNRHFAEDAGLRDPAEVVGKTDYDFYPADVAEKHQREDRDVMETGMVFTVVEELRTSAEEKLFLQVVKAPIEDDMHRIAGVLVVCSVTSLRRPQWL